MGLLWPTLQGVNHLKALEVLLGYITCLVGTLSPLFLVIHLDCFSHTHTHFIMLLQKSVSMQLFKRALVLVVPLIFLLSPSFPFNPPILISPFFLNIIFYMLPWKTLFQLSPLMSVSIQIIADGYSSPVLLRRKGSTTLDSSSSLCILSQSSFGILNCISMLPALPLVLPSPPFCFGIFISVKIILSIPKSLSHQLLVHSLLILLHHVFLLEPTEFSLCCPCEQGFGFIH